MNNNVEQFRFGLPSQSMRSICKWWTTRSENFDGNKTLQFDGLMYRYCEWDCDAWESIGNRNWNEVEFCPLRMTWSEVENNDSNKEFWLPWCQLRFS